MTMGLLTAPCIWVIWAGKTENVLFKNLSLVLQEFAKRYPEMG